MPAARAGRASARALLSAALFLHRFLIPEPQPVTVRIAELGTVAPKHLHRRMNKGYVACDQRVVLRLDVIDLYRKRNAGTVDDLPFVQENRQVGIVAHRRGLSAGDFEFYFEIEMIFIPIA